MLAATGGLLLILAYPPFGLPLLAVPALVLLATALQESERRSTATLVGMTWAATFFGIQMHWLPPVLEDSMRLNWLAYVGVVGCLVLLGGLLGSSTWQLGRAGWGTGVAFAVSFTGVEWVRAHLGPLSFPWLGVGTAFGGTPLLMGPVTWVGERGLVFVASGASGVLAAWIVGRRRRDSGRSNERGGRVIGGTVGLWALACGLLWMGTPGRQGEAMRGEAADAGTPVSLAVVTTEFGLRGHVGVEDRLSWVEAALAQWSSRSGEQVDAVVLPEGTVPLVLSQRPDLVNRLATLSAELGVPLVLGTYGVEADATFNSTVWVDRAGVGGRSDKRHKIAVVESGFSRGSPAVLGGPDVRLGAMICFESLFTDVARDLARAGANVLINPTSEAWFRKGGAWAAAQHGEHLRSRSLETGRWILRIANEGESLLLDPSGRIQWRSAAPGVERVELRALHRTTVYSRVGDGVGLFCGFVVLLVLLSGARVRSGGMALNPSSARLYSDPTEP